MSSAKPCPPTVLMQTVVQGDCSGKLLELVNSICTLYASSLLGRLHSQECWWRPSARSPVLCEEL